MIFFFVVIAPNFIFVLCCPFATIKVSIIVFFLINRILLSCVDFSGQGRAFLILAILLFLIIVIFSFLVSNFCKKFYQVTRKKSHRFKNSNLKFFCPNVFYQLAYITRLGRSCISWPKASKIVLVYIFNNKPRL